MQNALRHLLLIILWGVSAAAHAQAEATADTTAVPVSPRECLNQYQQRDQELRRQAQAAQGGTDFAEARKAEQANSDALKRCGAQFSVDAVADDQVADLIELYRWSGQYQLALAATERSLRAPVRGPERVQRLTRAAEIYLYAFLTKELSDSAASALLEAVISEMDRLPDASVAQRIEVKYKLLQVIEDATDVNLLPRQIAVAREIVELSGEAGLPSTVGKLHSLLYWLGLMYADAGQIDAAIESLTRAAEAAPTAANRWWPTTVLTRLRLVGKPAPAIEAPYWFNTPPDLRRYSPAESGKATVMIFTSHACGPCKERYPGAVRLYEKYRDQGVEFILVAQTLGFFVGKDGIQEGLPVAEEVEANRHFFVDEFGFRMAIVLDTTLPASDGEEARSRIEQQYGIDGYPQFVVIGRDGIVRAAQRLGPGTGEVRLEAAIRAALAPSKPGRTAAAPSGRPLSIADILRVEKASWVSLAPDGEHVRFATSQLDVARNTTVQHLYLASTRAPTVSDPAADLTPLPLDLMGAVWSADGQALTYLRADGACTAIMRHEISTGQSSPHHTACLAPAGNRHSLHAWSPDGRYATYVTQASTSNPAADELDTLDQARTGVDVGVDWIWGLEVASPALRSAVAMAAPEQPRELWVFDRKTGDSRRISQAGVDVRLAQWAPAGHRVAWTAIIERDAVAAEDAADPAFAYGGVYGLGIADLTRSKPGAARPVGRITAHQLTGLRMQWSAAGRQIVLSRSNELAVYDTDSRHTPDSSDGAALQPVFTKAFGPVDFIAGLAWPRMDTRSGQLRNDAGTLYVTLRSSRRQRQVALELRSGNVSELFRDQQWYGVPSFAADQRTYAVVVESVSEPPRVYLGEVESAALRELIGHEELNPQFLELAPLQYEMLSWRSWDDRWDLAGVLIAPPGAATGRPLPTIVVLDGAGAAADLRFSLGAADRLPILPLAAAGYAVFVPNARGRNGINPGGYTGLAAERTYFSKPWRDVMQGVDLIVARAMADPERMGLIGLSYGGAHAAYGITQTNRFKAAVLFEPVGIDLLRSWQNVWGRPQDRRWTERDYGIASPFTGAGAEWLAQESAITHVSKVQTPTLLEFGAKSGQAMSGGNIFYQALQSLGVPSTLILYPRTGHGFEEPLLLVDSFHRELQWFQQWLGPTS